MEDTKIKKKLCCFFDLAGFSEKTQKNSKVAYEYLKKVTNSLRSIDKTKAQESNLEITTYSDSFIITCDCEETQDKLPDPDTTSFFLIAISIVQTFMYSLKPILTSRGYITFDECINNNELVFGKAIVKCAEEEKKIKMPYILVDRCIYKSYRCLKDYRTLGLLYKFVYKSSPVFLNVFSQISDSKDAKIIYEGLVKKLRSRDKTEYTLDILFLLNCFLLNGFDKKYNIKFRNSKKYYFPNLLINKNF